MDLWSTITEGKNHEVMVLHKSITSWFFHAVMVLHKSITSWFSKYSENQEKFVKTQRTLCQLSVAMNIKFLVSRD